MQTKKTPDAAASRQRWTPLIILAALTLGTLLAVLSYPQYVASGDELLSNSHFSAGLSGWQQLGRSRAFSQHEDLVILSQQSHKDNSRLTQTIQGNELSGVYLVSTELGSRNLVTGGEDWQNGAVVLIRGDENNKRIGSYEIVGIQGTQAPHEYHKFIEVPEPTAHITLTARMLNATGELLVKSISLQAATRQEHYTALRIGIIAAWSATCLALLIGYLRRYGLTTPFIIICVITALAVIGTLMPKQFTIDLNAYIANLMPEQFSNGLKQILDFFFPGYIGHSNQEISKFGHWVAFFSLAAAAMVFLRRVSVFYIAIGIMILAAATETLQSLTSARTPHIYDFVIDIAGALVGFIATLPVRWKAQRSKGAG